MSNDTDKPPEESPDEWWQGNVVREPDPGKESYTPVPTTPIPISSAPSSEPSPDTSEVTIISASSEGTDERDEWIETPENEQDEWANDETYEEDDNHVATPESPVIHTWRFIGEVMLYSLLIVVAFACIALVDFVALRSWEAPVSTVVIVTIISLISAIWLYARYMRRADRRWDESNPSEPDEEILYDRIPHISMFLNSIVIQAAIWIVSFILVSLTLNLMGSAWYWHVLVQAIVTVINAYFVTRTYVNWTRTRYIVTRASVVIMRPDLFWLRLRNNPRKEILAHTLVDHGRRKSTISEKFAYNTRGTAMLTTQEEGTGSTIILPYISGIEHFIDAASASRKAGRQ